MSTFPVLHFSFMALALVLCITAIIIVRKKQGTNWLKKHALINIAGTFAAILGLLSMFYFKSSMGYPHFKSPHALGGLVTLIILLCMPVIGNLVMSGRQNLRKPHRVLGRAVIILMIITAAFGTIAVITR